VVAVSRENVEIVRRGYEAWARGDMAAVLDAFDPEIEWWEREEVPDERAHRGIDAIRTRLAELDEMWIGLAMEPRELIDAGEYVVVPFRLTGRGRVSRAAVAVDEVHVFRLRDGKILELREFNKKAEALEAVGLEE
jgi:ketosteroid isomerase-like protein